MNFIKRNIAKLLPESQIYLKLSNVLTKKKNFAL